MEIIPFPFFFFDETIFDFIPWRVNSFFFFYSNNSIAFDKIEKFFLEYIVNWKKFKAFDPIHI